MRLPRLTQLLTCVVLVTAGCGRNSGAPTITADGLTKIRVGYIGITCEAPIFSAVENGFFKEEGLEVELVKCEWSKYKDVLALGGFDITHHLVMYFLKPIEQGLDVKFTGGIHRGCLRVQGRVEGQRAHGARICAGSGSACRGWGRRRSSSRIACWARMAWTRRRRSSGGFSRRRTGPGAGKRRGGCGRGFGADRHAADGAMGKVRNVADQATDAPYRDEYCCAVIVNGKFLAANPKAAAAATRALLKGAKWVETNPAAAARMSVEKKYLASNPELNTVAISHLRYVPSVSGAEAAVKSAAAEMKTCRHAQPEHGCCRAGEESLRASGGGDGRMDAESCRWRRWRAGRCRRTKTLRLARGASQRTRRGMAVLQPAALRRRCVLQMSA